MNYRPAESKPSSTLAAKPKLTNGTSDKKVTSPTKPIARPLGTASDKLSKDATNKQVLNKAIGSAPAKLSPKPTTTVKKTTDVSI